MNTSLPSRRGEKVFQQIITTLDGSQFGERALTYTRDLAKIAGARVNLLSVVPTASPAPGATDAEPPAEATQDAEVAYAEEHHGKAWLAYLEGHAQRLREDGIQEVVTHVRFGDPARLISALARELEADLVVMSTQGMGADGQFALGSVALKVLSTAPCPVFMVRINRPEPPRSTAEERWQAEGGRNVG